MHERRTGDQKISAHRVSLRGSTVHIGDLDVHLDAAAEYMRGIPAEKLEAAFVHAVQVGMTEIVARRRRFQMNASAPAPSPKPSAVRVLQPDVVAPLEKTGIQPTLTAPPEPRMESTAQSSIEARSAVAPPQPEPEHWLKRLDEDFEILDPVHAAGSFSSRR